MNKIKTVHRWKRMGSGSRLRTGKWCTRRWSQGRAARRPCTPQCLWTRRADRSSSARVSHKEQCTTCAIVYTYQLIDLDCVLCGCDELSYCAGRKVTRYRRGLSFVLIRVLRELVLFANNDSGYGDLVNTWLSLTFTDFPQYLNIYSLYFIWIMHNIQLQTNFLGTPSLPIDCWHPVRYNN